MFDFKKAKASALAAMTSTKLEAVILGHSGAGKSHVLGTLGVKTLLIYGTRENHGPKSAATKGGDNIVPVCIDYGVWGSETEERDFTADESYLALETILKNHDSLRSEGFGAIAIDGLTVLEGIVKETSLWKDKCKTAAGKHNTFKESESSQELLGNVIGWGKAAARELGCHFVVAGILDVKEKDQYGAIQEATPRMGGYGLAEALVQHFADVLVVGKMSRAGEVKYKFQFLSDLSRVSKDEHGSIKKSMNFAPRLTGVKEVPPFVDADLSILAAMKAKK